MVKTILHSFLRHGVVFHTHDSLCIFVSIHDQVNLSRK